MEADSSWVVAKPTVDHSTLAAYAGCPLAAASVERGLVQLTNRPLIVGQAVHDAFAAATKFYTEFGMMLREADLLAAVTKELHATRPDIQPDAIEAGKPSIYAWSRWMAGEINPQSIMRHDGGKDERSGQLTRESDGANVTSEVDLLLATPSPELVRIVDYKSGWTPWDEDAVYQSFQFQLHAWLVFANYPEVEAVEVSVWMTRLNKRTRWVRFERRNEDTIDARIEAAVQAWWRWKDVPLDEIPAWPIADNCKDCPVLSTCKLGKLGVGEQESPESCVDRMAYLEAEIERLQAIAAKHVETTGMDIVTAHGNAFGIEKPKREAKPRKALYRIGKE